jgi:hypothetical protein
MAKADLGFEKAKNGNWIHQQELTTLEAWCVDSIRVYNSRKYAPNIPARDLADWLGITTRDLRILINHLVGREYHGLPICMLPGGGGGYFVADKEALKERAKVSIQAQLTRAKTGARKARDMGATNKELADSVVQLTLDLGSEVENQVAKGLTGPKKPVTHREIMRTIRKYAADPMAFAREIGQLRSEFAGLFVRQEDLARVMRKQTGKAIEAALAELAGEKVA